MKPQPCKHGNIYTCMLCISEAILGFNKPDPEEEKEETHEELMERYELEQQYNTGQRKDLDF